MLVATETVPEAELNTFGLKVNEMSLLGEIVRVGFEAIPGSALTIGDSEFGKDGSAMRNNNSRLRVENDNALRFLAFASLRLLETNIFLFII